MPKTGKKLSISPQKIDLAEINNLKKKKFLVDIIYKHKTKILRKNKVDQLIDSNWTLISICIPKTAVVLNFKARQLG